MNEYAPFDAAFKADPFPLFRQLQVERPVHRVNLAGVGPIWLIARYDDAMAVLSDPRFVKDARHVLTPAQKSRFPKLTPALALLQQSMLSQDPPNHTRLRALVSRAFTPRRIDGLRPRIQQLADELLDKMAPRGEADLITDYALPIPITIIGELLGVPDQDRVRLRAWSSAFISAPPTDKSVEQLASAVDEYVDFFRSLFALRRGRPQDDLISALVRAEGDGDRLSETELFSMTSLILIAGHETTAHLIGNGTLALLQHPDQLERLRREPNLLGPAIEELLRHASPVEAATERWAAEDITVGGVTIPRGELVHVLLGSANRDANRYIDPDTLDLTRDARQHLAFGHGIHYCVGAPLARLEGRIALGTLIQRLPDLRLTVPFDQLRWRPGIVLRGLAHLPVAFGRRK
ncbi:MAG: cytochrome P450 [Chloroflexi bacterium]|nr:cytochrome P450 [Chloroflexota bacterium]